MECIPQLHVRGSYYNVGYSIGKTFRSMISELLRTWNYFNQELLPEYRKPRGQELYNNCLDLCNMKFPHYIEEIKGMADGTNIDFNKLFLLNIDSIILAADDNCEKSGQSVENGCTSILCNRDEIILGHTEDALKDIWGNVYVVSAEICDDNGETVEKFTTFSYAGHLMGYTMGFNDKGMVYSLNTLFPHVYKSGTPRAFVARALLNCSSLDETLCVLRDAGSGISDGFSLNLFFSEKELEEHPKCYNIEVHPPLSDGCESVIDVVTVEQGHTFAHCNMYLRQQATQPCTPLKCSQHRHNTIDKFQEIKGLNEIKDILSDQSDTEYPVFICENAQTKMMHIQTVAVGLFDLKKKVWSIYIGPPASTKPVAVIQMDY